MLYKGIVAPVQSGPIGGGKSTSPPKYSWHHNAYKPTTIERIPRAEHKAYGLVQNSLHPNQKGGLKKLGG